MTCPKCEGLMVSEDIFVGSDSRFIPIFRCLNCGEIIDAGILKNREHRPIIRKWRRCKHGDKKSNRK